MIIDSRKRDPRSERAMRTKVIDAETREEVRAVAINTLTKRITFKVTKKDRVDLFTKYRTESYPPGKYILCDTKSGVEWSADDIEIPCQKNAMDDCICFSCLLE